MAKTLLGVFQHNGAIRGESRRSSGKNTGEADGQLRPDHVQREGGGKVS
jgi:hypothetical protein